MGVLEIMPPCYRDNHPSLGPYRRWVAFYPSSFSCLRFLPWVSQIAYSFHNQLCPFHPNPPLLHHGEPLHVGLASSSLVRPHLFENVTLFFHSLEYLLSNFVTNWSSHYCLRWFLYLEHFLLMCVLNLDQTPSILFSNPNCSGDMFSWLWWSDGAQKKKSLLSLSPCPN